MKVEKLTGSRAILIPLGKEHTAGLYEASQAVEIWTYLPQQINSLTDTEKFVEDALKLKEMKQDFPFTVYDQLTSKIVGSTRLLNISAPNRSLEIGWTWYHPSVWRTRVNTECKYMLLKYCFETWNAVRVQFCADVRNDRSNRAIERIGAIREGRLRKNRILSDGYIRDAYIYSIIAEEWPVVKAQLEHVLEDKAT
ncbi:MAG: N-acetyltransferase [Paenibacillus sp.]|jgi:RimJ/RimL family protein N-acetyltransferase|nr:N-acetyltransferase [Paenibacillus sp.]